MRKGSTYSPARGWLLLIRPPNLLTVPGDPLAGFMLARMAGAARNRLAALAVLPQVEPPLRGAILCAAAAALLLYIAGLISNDCADLDEDRNDRADRPLPSGAISLRAARAAWLVTAAAGLACAFAAGIGTGIAALLLLTCILLYNYGAKHKPVGALVMGACRGLSLLLGAAAAGWTPRFDAVGVAAIGLTLYVTAVTAIAARETEAIRIGFKRWAPALVLLAGTAGVFVLAPPGASPWFVLPAACGIVWALRVGRALAGTPSPSAVGASVGKLIRGLLLLQAAFAAMSGAAGLALVLLCLWPASAILARKFYSS